MWSRRPTAPSMARRSSCPLPTRAAPWPRSFTSWRPAPQLAFHSAANSEADFAAGITQLQKLGANIIVDDVGYPDEPFFQDGVVAQAINAAAAQGVAYFSAAGNDGRNSYETTTPVFVAQGRRSC